MSYRVSLLEANQPWLRDLAERNPNRVRWARRRYTGRQVAFARMALMANRAERERWLDGLVDVWNRVDEMGGRLRLTAEVALSHESRALTAALVPRPALFTPVFSQWLAGLDESSRGEAQAIISRLRVGLCPVPGAVPRWGGPLRLHDFKVGGRRARWSIAEIRDEAQLFVAVGLPPGEALRIAHRVASQNGLELEPDSPSPPAEHLPGDFRGMVCQANVHRLETAFRVDSAQAPGTVAAWSERRNTYRRCGMMPSDLEIRDWVEGIVSTHHHLDQVGVRLSAKFEFPRWNRPGTVVALQGGMRLVPLVPSPEFREWLDALSPAEHDAAEAAMRQIQAGVLCASARPRGMDRYQVELGRRKCSWTADRHEDVCYLAGVDIDANRAEQIVLRLVRQIDDAACNMFVRVT